MSLYGEYLKERSHDSIVEDEYGFATYRFVDEKTVYIIDIYVKPDHRKEGLAASYADDIAKVAKERGCTHMMGSIVPSMKGSHTSLLVLLAYGMKLDSCANDFIVMKKEI